jgi:glycosyltransferase involved in cell wall biosynthesis
MIMTVYNEADRLPATLQSILEQTYENYELIIIDDGSTDRTWQILSDLRQPRLRLHRNIPNQGQTPSLIYALSLAQGKYIARHDASDVSSLDRFEQQVRYLDSHKKVAAVGTQVDWVDAAGAVLRHMAYPEAYDAIKNLLVTKEALVHGSAMIRKTALDAVGGYRDAFRLSPDVDLWLRLSEKYPLVNLPETLYRLQFAPQMLSVARSDEYQAYATLARQLAAERKQHGSEQTDLAQAADAIRQRYEGANPFAQRASQARNLTDWAERLKDWGEPASRQIWPLVSSALLAWPFSPSAWQFVFRQLRKSSA